MKYKVLFSIGVLHDYFTGGTGSSFVFTPTPACKQLLSSIGALIKVHNHELLVVVKEDGTDKPFIPLPDNALFEFYWQPIDAQFFSYTQLDIPSGKRLYWHNHQPNTRNGIGYLHALPPAFNNANAYTAGSFVTGAAETCFEALVNLAAGSNLGNANQWANRGQTVYADTSGLLDCKGPVAMLPVTPASHEIVLEIHSHFAGGQPIGKLLRSETITLEKPVTEYGINLTGMPVGLYQVVVNGNAHILYADNTRDWYHHAGIIAIGHFAHLNDTYRLIAPDGKLESPQYTVRLAPRAVIWQYQARTDAVKTVSDENNAVVFAQTGTGQFTSQLPVRLNREPYRHMVLEYNNTSPPDANKTVKIKNLPVPDGSRLGSIRQNDTDYLLAITHLHY